MTCVNSKLQILVIGDCNQLQSNIKSLSKYVLINVDFKVCSFKKGEIEEELVVIHAHLLLHNFDLGNHDIFFFIELLWFLVYRSQISYFALDLVCIPIGEVVFRDPLIVLPVEIHCLLKLIELLLIPLLALDVIPFIHFFHWFDWGWYSFTCIYSVVDVQIFVLMIVYVININSIRIANVFETW